MNRKKRKLIYIRAKNALRQGKNIGYYFKMSREVVDAAFIDIVSIQIECVEEEESKYYKLPLKAVEVSIDSILDDFAKEIFTVGLKLAKWNKQN